ncbi:hypothetical protein, conserved [Eimeria necatrix]|uniref:Integrase catalytic domain-containing protein n=1 Tax=Eimeria necatrix TaxID=51315 RepID=U6N958_9EIME|nr:hypothetical protein, conserved [Eimeria necatrix]CDJ70406.1 hypothetical protein, conserved [Eimeria necatrix]
MVDSLSKMTNFVPAKKSFKAADTVQLLADRLIRYHGFPEVLISDRNPGFQSALWQQLCRRFNIKRAMFSSYHPQSEGQTERVNRTLEQLLRTYIQSDKREWERLLPAVELVYNTASHSPTKLSPFELMVGENALTAANLDIVGALAPTLTPPMTKLFRQLCDKAQSHIQKAKLEQSYYADTKRRAVEYAVATSSPPPPPSRLGSPGSRYRLAAYPPCTGNLIEEYEVDYIMDQRGSGADAQYLVKWSGTPEDQAT